MADEVEDTLEEVSYRTVRVPEKYPYVEGICPRGSRQLMQKEGIVSGWQEQRCSCGGLGVVQVPRMVRMMWHGVSR